MTQTYNPPSPATSRIRLILIVVWAAMSVCAAAFVFFFGSNAPWGDEWNFVPAVVNAEPTLPWLWEQHNEHRLPLTRAVYYLLFQLTHDFRAGMYAQVVLLSALSLALMKFAERLRGRPAWYDAFFPVSLLNLGHWENFIMGYQLFFVIFTVLPTGIIVVAIRTTRENAFRSGVVAGILLLLAMLSGAFGLALAPPVGLWLVYLAVIVWRRDAKWKALVLVGIVAVAAAYFIPYFDGYHRPAHHPEFGKQQDRERIPAMTGIILSLAFGPGLGPAWWAVAAGEVVLGVATVVM
ncbi:MAG TPA: hypothetical protein VLM40_11220, partial [Gemmata sp.]|nr:hypothetical protein [Gemmata sp.]